MSFYVSTATFVLLHCDEWDRVVALPRDKFVTGATLLQLGSFHHFSAVFTLSFADGGLCRHARSRPAVLSELKSLRPDGDPGWPQGAAGPRPCRVWFCDGFGGFGVRLAWLIVAESNSHGTGASMSQHFSHQAEANLR